MTVASKKVRKREYVSRSESISCHDTAKVPHKLQNKSGNSPTYDITRVCSSTSAIQYKNGRSCQENGTSVKGKKVSDNIRQCNYDLYFKTVMIKHAEQTTVKQQENIVSPKANV
jgi:hypothetical protein